MHYVYILECADSSLYAGYTNDLDKRLKVHNQGKGAKYTRARLPVKLVYSETVESKSAGLKREYQIKQMTRKQKEKLLFLSMET
ncbi:MAG TPA: GIY-YIG nuclease family protein [Ruminiclostridium sp.]